jgi:hypothetical protein
MMVFPFSAIRTEKTNIFPVFSGFSSKDGKATSMLYTKTISEEGSKHNQSQFNIIFLQSITFMLLLC